MNFLNLKKSIMKGGLLMFLTALLFMLIPIVSAEDIFMNGEPIDLKVFCSNQSETTEDYCSLSASCYLTVNNPYGQNIINYAQMSNNTAYFNYTIPAQKMNGDYSSSVRCCQDNKCQIEQFTFGVSSTGQREIPPIATIVALGIIAVLLLFISYLLSPDLLWIKVAFVFLSTILALFVIPASLISESVNYNVWKWSFRFFSIFGSILLLYIIWHFINIYIIQPLQKGDNDG